MHSWQALAIGVFGGQGRMGQSIIQVARERGFNVVGTTTRETAVSDTKALCAHVDVLIDFTSPDALGSHLAWAVEAKKPVIIGTTGLSDGDRGRIQAASLHIPIVYATNMSRTVNVLFYLTQKAAGLLDASFDADIIETHHRHKKDAPSGTARTLIAAVSAGRGVPLVKPEGTVHGSGLRTKGDIGIAVQRGGDHAGSHSVSFFGEGEIFTLSQQSTDRITYARGAVDAAHWILSKPCGLYSMLDVLGLSDL